MKPTYDQLKSDHEMFVASEFVRFIRTRGQELGDPVPGDIQQREPDAVSIGPGGRVGIEVATGYYTGEAKNVWEPARGRPERSARYVGPNGNVREALQQVPILVNPDEDLAGALRKTMRDHCQKTYSISTYLVLDATPNALTTAEDSLTLLEELLLPTESTFLGAYLALRRNYSNQVVFFQVPRS